MKTFHIVYFEQDDKFYSKGLNIDANTMLLALLDFEEQHPNAHVFCCIDKTLEPIRNTK